MDALINNRWSTSRFLKRFLKFKKLTTNQQTKQTNVIIIIFIIYYFFSLFYSCVFFTLNSIISLLLTSFIYSFIFANF